MSSPSQNIVRTIISLFVVLSPTSYAYDLPKSEAKKYSPEIEVLQKISDGISSVSEEAKKAIVFISTSKTIKGSPYEGQMNPFEFFFGPMPYRRQGPEKELKEKALGSGFIVDLDKGYILTNNHVIDEADEITVKFANEGVYTGKVLGRDKNTDIAIVQVKNDKFNRKGLTQLLLGDSDTAKSGEFVIAVGAPFALEASLSFGILSATQRGNLQITNLGNFLQTDAAINPGNSGGPLLDTKGLVIGMNTAIYSRSGGSAGIGFAIPSNLIRKIVPQLISQGHISRGFIGVNLSQELDEEINGGLGLPTDLRGALISHVEPGAPAHKGGLSAGDVVTAIDGKKVSNNGDLTNAVGLMPPGKVIAVEYYRDGKKHTAEVKLSAYPDKLTARNEDGNDVVKDVLGGLKLSQVTPESAGKLHDRFEFESARGLLITEVAPGSRAEAAGLRPGDVLLKTKGKALTTVAEFKKLSETNKKLLIHLERKGNFLFAMF